MSKEIRSAAVASGEGCSEFFNAGEPAVFTSYIDADATTIARPSDTYVEGQLFQEFWNSRTADGPCSGKSKQTSDCSGKCNLCSNHKQPEK